MKEIILSDKSIKMLLKYIHEINVMKKQHAFDSLADVFEFLYRKGFDSMSPYARYESLSKNEQRQFDLIIKMLDIKGNRHKGKKVVCPMCRHKNIAYNYFDDEYPYDKSFMNRNDMQPLTYFDKDDDHKYYCMSCGSKFGERRELKKIFSFNRGAYLGGTLIYRIYEGDDCMLFEGKAYNKFCHSMKDYLFRFPKDGFDVVLKRLNNIRKWKESYECEYDVHDGYSFSVNCDYQDNKIKTSGYVEYPRGYRHEIRRLQFAMEKLCKKYADEYQSEGLIQRVML